MKLSDFGTARIKTRLDRESTFQGVEAGPNPGTQYYQAPEVQVHGNRAQMYSDVWSGCLTMLEWVMGKKAWKTSPTPFVMKHEGKMPYILPKAPKEIRDILTQGLSYQRKERPTAADIAAHFQQCVQDLGRCNVLNAVI